MRLAANETQKLQRNLKLFDFMEIHYAYIIRNLNGVLYKGYSGRPFDRLAEHNQGSGHYTSGKGPWKIVYLKEFQDKRSALIFERKLKRMNTENVRVLIAEYSRS